MLMPGSHTYFLEVNPHVSKKEVIKDSFKGKKTENLAFLRILMQNPRNATKKIDIPCSVTYFLEVGAHVLLRVSTKGYFNGKKILTN